MQLVTEASEFKVELVRGTKEDKPLFARLTQLYLYDDSEHNGEDLNAHGYYEYHYLDHYWTPHREREERRLPYLIRVNGALAGFVLIAGFSQLYVGRSDTYSISEFFVMRKWRKLGVGRSAACLLFERFPGHWEVRQERTNTAAQLFWINVIARYTNGAYTATEALPPYDGPVLVFQSGQGVINDAG